MSLLDRLGVNRAPEDTNTISADAFAAYLVGMRDLQFTRAEVEADLDISNTGVEEAEMTFLINSFNAAANKERWFLTMRAAVLLAADNNVPYNPTKAELQAWIQAGES